MGVVGGTTTPRIARLVPVDPVPPKPETLEQEVHIQVLGHI